MRNFVSFWFSASVLIFSEKVRTQDRIVVLLCSFQVYDALVLAWL